MPNDRDLFQEEQTMVAMSFGDHIEDLRKHLVRALLGLFVGVVITFIPPLDLGQRVMRKMQDPAQKALDEFYSGRAIQRAKAAALEGAKSPMTIVLAAGDFVEQLRKIAPELNLPAEESLKGQTITFKAEALKSEQILNVATNIEQKNALISLAPMETMTIFFTVCMVTGLVLSSPWVFYQVWAFIAAGLFRHERHYVTKYLPYSIGLFLAGVALCFFIVLPVTLQFLLDFNVWLGVEPTLRISEWMGFATIMPVVFGVCFQTPLIMLFLEKIGIFTIDDFRSKRKISILVMMIAAAIITPTSDPFSMLLLAVPMVSLYELGIFMIGRNPRKDVPSDLAV